MSIKNKTLAVMIAAALGVSFGASANGGYGGGYGGGWGHGGGYEDPECCTGGTDNTNDDGNQAVDDSEIYDIDVDYTRMTKNINKDILNGWDNSVRVRMDTNLNYQKNFTYQGGKTGDTVSASFAGSHADADAGNLGFMKQESDNGALGVGVGLGAGLGAASSEADGGGSGHGGNVPYGHSKRGGYGGREDGNGDVESGDAGGAGFGSGFGAGAGMAQLAAVQDLDQQAASASWSQANSVSMITSGNNNIGNTGATYGINVQQGISGHSALGNQSVNVNSSMQF